MNGNHDVSWVGRAGDGLVTREELKAGVLAFSGKVISGQTQAIGSGIMLH